MNDLFRKVYSATAGLLLCISALPLRADIIGTSALNPDGSYTYSYTVDNTSGVFDISYWSLEFDFATPDWDQADTFAGGGVTVPDAEWWATAGIAFSGLSAQDFLSLSPSADALAGASLGGFSFTSWFAPGMVTFAGFDPFASSSIQGTTVGPSSANTPAVPEGSGSYGLMAAGFLAGSVLLRRKGASSPDR